MSAHQPGAAGAGMVEGLLSLSALELLVLPRDHGRRIPLSDDIQK